MKRYLFPLLVVLLLAITYRNNFVWLWNSWMNNPDYSHGPLIPLISAFLVWRKKELLHSLPRDTDARGLLICILAILLQIFSLRASVHFTSSYSLIFLFLGLAMFFFGKKIAGVLLFPIAYLVFMVPFFRLIIIPISNNLKLLSSILASNIVRLTGIPILREGVILHLSASSLEVADPCSGIRSMMSLLALGTLFAYLADGNLFKKAILVFCAVPLAFLGNLLRLLVLLFTAEYSGMVIPEGFLHSLIGFSVFATAIVGLLLVKRLIRC